MARTILPAPARLRTTRRAPARLIKRATDSYLASVQISQPPAPSQGLLSWSVTRCWSLFRAVIFGIPLMLFVLCFLTGIAIEDIWSAEKKRQAQSRVYSDD